MLGNLFFGKHYIYVLDQQRLLTTLLRGTPRVPNQPAAAQGTLVG